MAAVSSKQTPNSRPAVKISKKIRDGDVVLCAELSDEWKISDGLSNAGTLEAALSDSPAKALEFDCSTLGKYDSSLVCYVIKCAAICKQCGIKFCAGTLPENVQKLLLLATSVPEKKESPRTENNSAFYHIGKWGESKLANWDHAVSFLGETGIAITRLFRGRARFRGRDCLYFVQTCGVDALPIITLISFITGMILAYIGAMQLQRFGAIIYVASLIALAMVREMGVLMSSVIMCGRTGSAFAAQIGSMQASDEISALRVLGINPVEYLVLPRLIALTLMMPLLTIYSDVIGMLGGLFVMGSMDVTVEQYWHQVVITLNMPHVLSGIIKSVFFGFIVAWAGCYRGMSAGKSSLDVGTAATSAAVLGMILIVIGDGIFAVIFNALNF